MGVNFGLHVANYWRPVGLTMVEDADIVRAGILAV
jgi:hypothetical protein